MPKPLLPPLPAVLLLLQLPKGVTADQIRGLCASYGEIVDLNTMPPKRDNAMGESVSSALTPMPTASKQLMQRVTFSGVYSKQAAYAEGDTK